MKDFYSLYIHVPFCSYKCPYCDFNTYAVRSVPEQDYVNALKKELSFYLTQSEWQGRSIKSIYWGGGTPSLVSAKSIEAIHSMLDLTEVNEITLEANPKEISRVYLREVLSARVDRLSLGAQSLNNKTLKALGRKHQTRDVIDAYNFAMQAGFENINLDLMFGAPGQTVDDIKQDLKDYLSLAVEHISCYELTIEKGTPFYQSKLKGVLQLPEEELVIEMYSLIREELKKANYIHYEISNFSKAGFESVHNNNYWQRGDYLGIGAGAHSFNASKDYGFRWSNLANYQEYINQVARDAHAVSWQDILTEDNAFNEYLMLSLRTVKGCSKKLIKQVFSNKMEVIDQRMKDAENLGYIDSNQDSWILTNQGQEVLDSVLGKICI